MLMRLIPSRKRKSASSPVFGSVSFACAGRTFSQSAMASPTRRSTGLVNALPVLFTGTSRKQTASRAWVPCAEEVSEPMCCQRIHPRRSRVISLMRRPAKSQVMTKARMSSNLKWVRIAEQISDKRGSNNMDHY